MNHEIAIRYDAPSWWHGIVSTRFDATDKIVGFRFYGPEVVIRYRAVGSRAITKIRASRTPPTRSCPDRYTWFRYHGFHGEFWVTGFDRAIAALERA